MKRLENLRRNSWRVGVIVAAVSLPLLAPGLFRRLLQTWASASVAMHWSMIGGCAALLLLVLLNLAENFLWKVRESTIRDERERIARELHDTLVQNCASVSMMLEAIASTSVAQSDLLNQAREQSRQTMEEARRTISGLRSSGEVDLLMVLRGVADEIRRSSGKCLEIKQNVAQLFVPSASADEISMTVREALRNAVRHSGSDRMTIDLKSRREGLNICIQDFGCGIAANAPAPAQGHFGLLGMHERMRRLGGGLDVKTVPGAGTSVQLVLRWGPLRRASARA